ncbi:hypothetical protein ACFLYE_03050 [Chloroflexota bacterium]
MQNRNLYTWTSLGLIVTGVLVSLSAYFIFRLNWLTALGIAMIILSLILLALGRTVPKLSPEVSILLLETGIDNISSLIEELGIRSKCLYLPAKLNSGRPRALIPLHHNTSLHPVTEGLPERLIVRYGAKPDDMGLMVTTLGTAAVSLLESIPGPIATEMESALTYLFAGTLGVADGTKVIHHENRLDVEIRNPRLESKTTWSHQCLGGPLASIAAAIAAEAWGKPVAIKQEGQTRGRYSIELEVLE